MTTQTAQTTFNKYLCQHCGHDVKLVQQIVSDRLCIDENGEASYMGLTDDFHNTGDDTCEKCAKPWTGETPVTFA